MEKVSTFNFAKVIDDLQSVILQPVTFYRRMQKTGGFAEPLIFALVMGAIGGLIIAFFSLLGGGRFAAAGFSAVILMPIMVVIWSFISGAIMFVVWKLMGSNHSYETAYRCVAYSTAIFPVIAIISLIPYLGSALGVIWGMYLMVIASDEVHGLDKKKALIVFGVLGFIAVMINFGSEKAGRKMEERMETVGQNMGDSIEGLSDMSPEEAGKALGEFMKGVEEASK